MKILGSPSFRSDWWGLGMFRFIQKGGPSCLRAGAEDDYVNRAKIHRQWWLFVRICFVIKKLIFTGSISVSVSQPPNFASYVCCICSELKFSIDCHNMSYYSFNLNMLNIFFSERFRNSVCDVFISSTGDNSRKEQ